MAWMAPITLLPAEILWQIFNYLITADKSRLSRVCKSLHGLVRTSLIEDIQIEINPNQESGFQFPPFLNNLIEAPEQAALIRKLMITGTDGEYVSKSSSSNKPGSLNPSQLKAWQIVQALGFASPPTHDGDVSDEEAFENGILDWERRPNDDDPWVTAIRNGDVDAYQALIFVQLPNLQALAIDHFHFVEFPFLSIVILNILSKGERNRFQNVRRVELIIPERYRIDARHFRSFPRRPSNVLTFLYLPNLQDFRLMMQNSDAYFDWPGAPPVARSLTTLHLMKSHLKPLRLGRLLSTTPSLKHLKYEFYRSAQPFQRVMPCIDCDELDFALAKVAGTLETLHLSVCLYNLREARDEWSHWSRPDLGIKGLLNSLKVFKHLQRLDCPIVLLLSAQPERAPALTDQLPSTIRHLSIISDRKAFQCLSKKKECILKALQNYVTATANSPVSSLSRLDLVIRSPLTIWGGLAQFQLRKECESHGVSYYIRRKDT